MTRSISVALALAAALAAGCTSVNRQSTGPSSASQMLAGTWTSFQTGSLQDSCTNFTWTVTEFNGNTGAGTFSATCFGFMQVNGMARGVLTGTVVNWTLTATASGPGVPAACTINLTGSAVLEGDVIRIPYSGSSCVGPLSGTEYLRRR